MTNPIRTRMVARAVQQTQNGKMAITVRNVSMFLPGPSAFDPKLKAMESFELDEQDLSPYLPAPTPDPGSLADRLADVEIEYVEPAPVESPGVRYQKLELRSLELERERADLRVTYDVAIRDELNARNELDRIARAFMQGFGAPITPDQLLKAHATTEAETRAKIAAGELPGRRRVDTTGPSVLDKFAAAQRGGRPGFAGRGYARGGQPVSKRIMPGVVAPRLGPSERPKLPSER